MKITESYGLTFIRLFLMTAFHSFCSLALLKNKFYNVEPDWCVSDQGCYLLINESLSLVEKSIFQELLHEEKQLWPIAEIGAGQKEPVSHSEREIKQWVSPAC